MDWDDIEPKKKVEIIVGDDLSQLSIEELRDRVEALKNETTRINEEIQSKQSGKSAADDIFKS